MSEIFEGIEETATHKAEAHFIAVGEIVAELEKENAELMAELKIVRRELADIRIDEERGTRWK